jgi:hypothetical protein
VPARLTDRAALAALAALAVVAAVLAVGSPVPAASAADPARTWSTSVTTVCVESHVGKSWDVKGAVAQWNRIAGGPTFVLKAHCRDYDDTVTVRLKGSPDRFTGWTDWYWDETGHLVHADITLNPQRIAAFDRRDQACMREHTTSHELGHALGLRHYPRSHAGAVMSYLGWRERCGRLAAHDRADFRELYPEVVTQP